MIHEPSVAPAGDLKTRRREEREEAILGAALDLIVRGGVDGLTVQALARAMRWSVGALYRYYPSKDAVLSELQVRVLRGIGRGLSAQVDAALGGADDSPDAALRALLLATESFRAVAEQEPAQFALICSVLATPQELLSGVEAAAVGVELRALLGSVGVLVQRATDRGALGPGPTLLLWSSMQGLLQMKKLARFDASLRDLPGLVHLLVDALLLGFGADPARLAHARSSL